MLVRDVTGDGVALAGIGGMSASNGTGGGGGGAFGVSVPKRVCGGGGAGDKKSNIGLAWRDDAGAVATGTAGCPSLFRPPLAHGVNVPGGAEPAAALELAGSARDAPDTSASSTCASALLQATFCARSCALCCFNHSKSLSTEFPVVHGLVRIMSPTLSAHSSSS